MEHHVDAPNRTIRESISTLVVLIDPSDFPKPVVHFLHICRSNRADFLVTQVRLDIIVGDSSVTIQRTFPDSEPHPLVQPLIQPFTESEIGVFFQLHIPEGFDAPVEFFHQLFLGFREHAAVNRLAIFLVSDYNSAFPATVTALSHQSVAIGPVVCQQSDLLS